MLYQTEILLELLVVLSSPSSLIRKLNSIIPEVSAVLLIYRSLPVLVIQRRPPLIEEITGASKVGGKRHKQTKTAGDEPREGDGLFFQVLGEFVPVAWLRS